MKKTLFSLFIATLISCSVSKKGSQKLEFIINTDNVTNNQNIDFKIKNNSNTNYFIPIDTTALGERVQFLLAPKESFFFIRKEISNVLTHKISTIEINCYENYTMEPQNAWENWKNKLSTKDMLLIRKGETVNLKIPFLLYNSIARECTYEYEDHKNYKTGTHQLRLKYSINPKFAQKILPIKLIDSLKQTGYQLYEGDIFSNRVPLIIN